MRFLLVLAVALMLAGCSESAKPATVVIVDSADTAVIDGNATKPSEAPPRSGERGHLTGIVVDETVTPVVGAVISLPGLEVDTKTDQNGAFAFSDLWPGPYYLEADAAGYDKVTAVVDVAKDAFTEVRIEMTRAPSEDPFHVTQDFNGFSDFAFDPFIGLTQLTCNQCSSRVFLDRGADTVIIEAARENPYDDPTVNQGWYATVEDSGGERITSEIADGALYIRLDADDVQDEVALLVNTYPTAYPVPEQAVAFEVYVTAFYNGEAPEDWSFLEGGP